MNIKAFIKRSTKLAASHGVDLPIRVTHKVEDGSYAETVFIATNEDETEFSAAYFAVDTKAVKAHKWASLEYIMLHEIAHAIAGLGDATDCEDQDAWHGPHFVKVADKLGAFAGQELDEDFLDILDCSDELLDR